MADTRIQLEVEDWVRRNWLAARFSEPFSRERMKLVTGGVFDFDAVSQSGQTVACISTSGSRTAGGKAAVGKLLKIRSDLLFLSMAADVRVRLLVLTEADMLETCRREQANGRVPDGIEFLLADIPEELRERLVAARRRASLEMTAEAVEMLPDELVLGEANTDGI